MIVRQPDFANLSEANVANLVLLLTIAMIVPNQLTFLDIQ